MSLERWAASIDPRIFRVPTPQERNEFQSAGTFLRRLAEVVTAWRDSLPPDRQHAIVIILQNGREINVSQLAQESFHLVRIIGIMDEKPCMVLAHQSSVQMLCVEEVAQEVRRKIGFRMDDQDIEV